MKQNSHMLSHMLLLTSGALATRAGSWETGSSGRAKGLSRLHCWLMAEGWREAEWDSWSSALSFTSCCLRSRQLSHERAKLPALSTLATFIQESLQAGAVLEKAAVTADGCHSRSVIWCQGQKGPCVFISLSKTPVMKFCGYLLISLPWAPG